MILNNLVKSMVFSPSRSIMPCLELSERLRQFVEYILEIQLIVSANSPTPLVSFKTICKKVSSFSPFGHHSMLAISKIDGKCHDKNLKLQLASKPSIKLKISSLISHKYFIIVLSTTVLLQQDTAINIQTFNDEQTTKSTTSAIGQDNK
ncbi:hypothetical protein CVS40_8268 [Lucilia cuprina]|nr:hypothetical protein CVS40_8268 [Lucilia cuprina]